jgi:hypothetical protein
MSGQRNYAPLLGLVLAIVGVATYFTVVNRVIAPWLPLLRNVPILNLALVGCALYASFVGVRRAFARSAPAGGRVLASILGSVTLGLGTLFVWYLFAYSSNLPGAGLAPGVAATAPDFSLPDQNGQSVRLGSLRGRNVLLVFYRGHW